jgi:hypothetical protein
MGWRILKITKHLIGTKERYGLKDATNETSKDKASGKVTSDEMAGRDEELEKQHGLASKQKQSEMHRNINSSKEASKEKYRDYIIIQENHTEPKKHSYVEDF